MGLEIFDRQRWTPKRKAALLAMIEAGEVEPTKLSLLGISQEELTFWRREFSDHGVGGLYVCSLHYHHPGRRKMRIARRFRMAGR
jgi:Protein of unknown function (DUF1153)